ncbi:hypothetical protein Q4Q39_04975 [Flavivirga amylovorans]|uniref:Uncharacterized protein n=1 Tax=Flavivirga amylovorans TaxID=870486 RepID=A0ABT8WZH3_9FLAO|nr:hypothetical protein [Flavivirga amylovorans]MDO5986755.1 hypothetical protein [Flavivirga amylovorans]
MTKSEIIELGHIIYDQRDISPAQLDVTSRQINYWVDKAVIPFVEKQQSTSNLSKENESVKSKKESTKTKWIRLNLSQAVWVCIVKELLSFGVSIENLAELARSIWQKPREDKYADSVFKDHIKNNKYRLSEEQIKLLKINLKDELLMEHYFRTIINPFTDMIKSALLRERLPHSILYVRETNNHEFLIAPNDLILSLGSIYLQHPMISLPIVPIISKVLAIDFGNPKKDLPYLANIEKQIRDIVVFKRPKIVEIAFEGNHIKPIIVTEQHKSIEQLAKYILENKIAKGSKLLIDIRSQGNYKLTLIK